VVGEKLPPGNYEDILRDGVILCNLINKLAPGSVKKIQAKGTNFQLMENIQRWSESELFSLISLNTTIFI
jgi:transgelin